MFTGLIEEVGYVERCIATGQAMELTVHCKKIRSGTKIGDSIAVNGVCLTVTKMEHETLTFDVMPQTFQQTNFRYLRQSSPVNLERALAASGRFGGHLVQGHVDGIGTLQQKQPQENAILFGFEVPEELTTWMIDQGSIAINGISLTLIDVQNNSCYVSLIPHTLAKTQLKDVQIGEKVNIECDLIGKYIAKWVQQPSAISIDQLKQVGFSQ